MVAYWLSLGGYIEIAKAWAKSLMKCMGYIKQKVYNAGKVTLSNFAELKEEFLADISAEVLTNDIPPKLIFNWDQTAIQFVPTGQWTMNQAKDKVISNAHSKSISPRRMGLPRGLIGKALINGSRIAESQLLLELVFFSFELFFNNCCNRSKHLFLNLLAVVSRTYFLISFGSVQ